MQHSCKTLCVSVNVWLSSSSLVTTADLAPVAFCPLHNYVQQNFVLILCESKYVCILIGCIESSFAQHRGEHIFIKDWVNFFIPFTQFILIFILFFFQTENNRRHIFLDRTAHTTCKSRFGQDFETLCMLNMARCWTHMLYAPFTKVNKI